MAEEPDKDAAVDAAEKVDAPVPDAPEPLYQQDPFDTITLDSENHDAVLKVFPLKLPGRKLPENPQPTDELLLRLVARPDEQFVVMWQNIASVKFFEQMVLDRAAELVEQQQFDEAYDYYRFLESKYPRLAGLRPAVETFLWKQMGLAYKQGRNDQALALLLQLHARNPQRKGLDVALARVTIKLVDAHLAGGRYRAARGLLAGLSSRYPETSAPTVAKYEGILTAKAATLLAEARRNLGSGKLREAYDATSHALEVWPTVAGGRQLAAEVHAIYPVVTVAVSAGGPTNHNRQAVDWPARRTARLLATPPAELVGVGETGGEYRSAWGKLEPSDDGTQLALHAAPELQSTGATAADVRGLYYALPRALVERADPQSRHFDAAWASAFSAVELTGVDELRVEFTRPQLCPAAWLAKENLLLGSDKSSNQPVGRGASAQPYWRDQCDVRQAVYLANSNYFAAQSKQPQQIIERVYSNDTAALRALERGDVQAIDRLPPWLWASAANIKSIRLEPYAVPSVHILVANQAKPLLASRAYRRALELGIDRQSILAHSLLGGHERAGCLVVSGPLPRSAETGDPHGYGYDEQIKPRPYDPTLAMMLGGVAMQEVAIAEKRLGHSFKAVQTLLVVHPPTAVARVACQSIARQLRLLGMQITLRELVSGESWPSEFDLAYVELPMHQPLVEVHALLGEGGLTGICSPAMHAALRELESAANWSVAKDRLRAIHRLAHSEVAVIGLWQIADRLARHEHLLGIGERPATLYQNIEHWQLQFTATEAAVADSSLSAP